ncbi:uncharacterized protein BDW47DRAFT_102484 [Aspergillus candidus]|uniref:Uncharacterized protein n=1 Tax=Aspergillus candidus TaxID=41067 RepID=A0A2I2FGR3_ASPCN|nr:hypothetical protein BDW47DRAFT_102484 [Aspergillus candidus]PLB39823.1 hypothetical protein BDW47DRAFT_102484 [Aspergillus candidus]
MGDSIPTANSAMYNGIFFAYPSIAISGYILLKTFVRSIPPFMRVWYSRWNARSAPKTKLIPGKNIPRCMIVPFAWW